MKKVLITSICLALCKVIQCTDLTSSACWPDAGYCISLNRHTSGIHWYQARTLCNIEAQGDILDILDHRMQTLTETVLDDISGNTLVWTGGRRSPLDLWINLDEDPFDKSPDDSQHGGNCGVLHKPEGQPLQYVTDNCDELTGSHYVICHTNISQVDCASSSRTWIQDTCYLTAATNRTSWYEAQNLCRGYPEYNGYLLDNTENHGRLSFVMENLTLGYQPAWFGIWRRYWAWTNGDVMSYFNWASGQGDLNTSGNCTVIQTDGRWRQEMCNSTAIDYVLCVNQTNDTATTENVAISTVTTVVVTDTDNPQGSGTYSQQPEVTPDVSETTDPDLYLYIGVAVGSAAVIVIILVVVLFCVRRYVCLKSSRNRPTGGQENTYTTPPESDDTGPDVKVLRGDYGTQSTVISPYAEVNIKTVSSSEPGVYSNTNSKTVPHADLDGYAITNPSYLPAEDTTKATGTEWSANITDESELVSGSRDQESPGDAHVTGRVEDVYTDVIKRQDRTQNDDTEDIMVDNTMYGEFLC